MSDRALCGTCHGTTLVEPPGLPGGIAPCPDCEDGFAPAPPGPTHNPE